MDRVLIVGAGGFGREVLLYLRDLAAAGVAVEVAGFLDDDPHALEGSAVAAPIIGGVDSYRPQPADRFVIAVGEPALRAPLAERLAQRGATFYTVIHPRAYLAASAVVREGCILAPYSFVGPGASVGRHVALNTYASVGHDACVGDFCVFAPYAVVNGNVQLGRQVFLGTHAAVTLGKTVGAYSKISAGSIATQDVPEGALVVGNPGKARVMFAAPPGRT